MEHTPWADDRFRDIDDSVATLVRQVVRAVAGMFVAFVVAASAARWWFGPIDDVAAVLRGAALFAPIGAVAIYLTSARPIRAAIVEQRRVIADSEDRMRRQVERQAFSQDVQSALEMAVEEDAVLAVIGEALGGATAGEAELLLADSSHAHLRRAAVAPGGDGPGCGVSTPWDCPAVRRGQTLRFESTASIAACPHLRSRASDEHDLQGLCVPVTVLGRPMGVLHAAGPAVGAWEPATEEMMEVIASQAGSRLGMLRAMAKSQLQASTDALTGLLNRRSLEERLHQLRTEGIPYALAFGDLDRFKELNDTYGHEAGDRALRTFSKVLASSVREQDVVSRYGGEEFVVLLPGLDVTTAAPVVHRVRQELARTVGTANIPPFTVSIGLADASVSDDPTDVLRAADAAMFAAKQQGRDRLVIADAAV